MNKTCQETGKMAYCWQDGLFYTIYCTCGAKLTIDETYVLLNSGFNNKFVVIPEHDNAYWGRMNK